MSISKPAFHFSVQLRFAVIAAIAVLVACALSATAEGDAPAASFTAVDFAWAVTGGSATSVHIEPGQSVAFDYQLGGSAHNVDFGARAPASCTQTAGSGSGAVPPLPATPTAPGWSGTCTFTTEQTYSFFCDLHSGMRGTIVVGSGGTTGGGTGGGAGGPTNPNTKNTLTSTSLKISKSQRSKVVRGTVDVATADSKFTAEAFATAKSLSSSAKPKRVGKFTKTLGSGESKFAISLSRTARNALKNKHKLSLTLKLKLTDPAGEAVTATRRVTLKS